MTQTHNPDHCAAELLATRPSTGPGARYCLQFRESDAIDLVQARQGLVQSISAVFGRINEDGDANEVPSGTEQAALCNAVDYFSHQVTHLAGLLLQNAAAPLQGVTIPVEAWPGPCVIRFENDELECIWDAYAVRRDFVTGLLQLVESTAVDGGQAVGEIERGYIGRALSMLHREVQMILQAVADAQRSRGRPHG
jgi:hypothetical protein